MWSYSPNIRLQTPVQKLTICFSVYYGSLLEEMSHWYAIHVSGNSKHGLSSLWSYSTCFQAEVLLHPWVISCYNLAKETLAYLIVSQWRACVEITSASFYVAPNVLCFIEFKLILGWIVESTNTHLKWHCEIIQSCSQIIANYEICFCSTLNSDDILCLLWSWSITELLHTVFKFVHPFVDVIFK